MSVVFFLSILLFVFGLLVNARLGDIFRLPFCEEVLGFLSDNDINKIRDNHQQWVLHKRIEVDLQNLLSKMREFATQPPDDPATAAAWKTDWTQDFVSHRLISSTATREHLEDVMRDLVRELRVTGQIQGSTSVHDLVQCSSGHLNPRLYPDRPVVSLMLQYFRRPTGIPYMMDLLESCSRQMQVELLVNVDSPEEGQTWANLSYSTRGRLVPVFSANLHEIRAYNRLAGLARGRVLVVLQDDDALHPADCSWLHPLLRQFDAMPRLGMVGLKSYRRGNGPAGNLERWSNTFHQFSDPDTGSFFTHPLQVDYAPIALRRAALLHVGGVDESMAEAGECGIMSDWELSIRMWTAGWQVGFMPLVQRDSVDDQPGSTHLPTNQRRCWGRQMRQAQYVYTARWGNGWATRPGAFLERLENDIRILNLKTLSRNYTQCPFRKGCDDLEGNPSLEPQYQRFFSYKQMPMVDA